MKLNSIKSNSVSFQGLYTNKLLKKGLMFAAENGSLFAATTSLALSTIARPLVILSTPNTDSENKKYACSKSLASSAVGYGLMLLVSKPIAKAVKNIDENPTQYLKPTTIKNLKDKGKLLKNSKKYQFVTELFKLGLGLFIALPKSALTSELVPVVMNGVFKNKVNENKQENKNKTDNISFKGLYNKEINKISKGIGKVINTNLVQTMSEKLHKTNFEQHIMSLTDILLTAGFVIQINKNKKMAKERKKVLSNNVIISTGLSLTAGYAINHLLKNPTEKFIQNFEKANKNNPDLDKYIKGIKVAKPALILSGIYYIIIPILSTFFAERVNLTKKK